MFAFSYFRWSVDVFQPPVSNDNSTCTNINDSGKGPVVVNIDIVLYFVFRRFIFTSKEINKNTTNKTMYKRRGTAKMCSNLLLK